MDNNRVIFRRVCFDTYRKKIVWKVDDGVLTYRVDFQGRSGLPLYLYKDNYIKMEVKKDKELDKIVLKIVIFIKGGVEIMHIYDETSIMKVALKKIGMLDIIEKT